MFRIGEFARLGGVTVRALHHYDDLGLLRPAGVSEGGHRLYAPGQLAALRRITALKALGASLDEIRTLTQGTPPEPYDHYLRRKRAELSQARGELDERLARLDAELAQEERMSNYTVQLKPLPALDVLAARGSAPDYRHVAAPMGALYRQVCGTLEDLALPHPGWSVVTWRGGGYQSEEEIELEVAIPVFGPADGPMRGGVAPARQPELLVASTIHIGSYERFGEAYAALLAWMEHTGHVPVGPVREVYLRASGREDEQLSELQVPVRRAG